MSENNETKTEIGTAQTSDNKETGAPSQKSLLEESKEVRDENRELLSKLKEENDRAERLASENMLGGVGGGREPQRPQLDPKEQARLYAQKVMSGKLQ